MTVYWLNKIPSNAKVYVVHRVAETKEMSREYSWSHVPTKDNPADLASKGLMPGEIVQRELWLHGPCWLKQTADHWPKNILSLTEENVRLVQSECNPSTVHVVSQIPPVLLNENRDLLMQFSSVRKLYRVTAIVRRFIKNCA